MQTKPSKKTNNMFCPYCQKTYTKATVIKYNEDNVEQGHVLSEYYGYYEYQQEKCGAWHRGKCRYK